MLSSNTNKLTWIGIAVGVIALVGTSTMILFPSAMDSVKSNLTQVVTKFTSNTTSEPVKDASTYSNLTFYYNDKDKTAAVGTSSHVSDFSNIDITIPEKVKYNNTVYAVTGIRNVGFYNTTFKSISMPNSIKTIENNAFANATIKSGTLSLSTNVQSIGEYAFNNLKGVSDISIPNATTKLSQNMFYGSDISSISIGTGVSEIPEYAFSEIANLTEISIPDSVKTIDDSAFFDDKKLRNVTFGQNVQSIDNSAFASTSLTSIVLPKSVISTSYSSFSNVDSAKPITISVDKSFDSSPNNHIGWPNVKIIR